MRNLIILIVFSIFTGFATAETQLEISLTDGSKLNATTKIKKLDLKSGIGDLSVKLSQIEAISRKPDGELFTVDLRNGDSLTAYDLGVETIKVQSLLGEVAIRLNVVDKLVFIEGGQELSLMLHYDFNEIKDGIVPDKSRFEHDGKTHGNIEIVDGIEGKGVRFRQSNDYIDCLYETLDVTGWPGATVSAWLHLEGVTTYGTVMSFAQVGGSGGSMGMSIGGQYGRRPMIGSFGVGDLGLIPPTFSAERKAYPPTGKWYHLVGTRDEQTVRFFINGELDGEKIADERIPLEGNPKHSFTIGKYRAHREQWRDSYPRGIIDEVKIWKDAMTPSQVKDLYLLHEQAG